jgi:hypothetical protein
MLLFEWKNMGGRIEANGEKSFSARTRCEFSAPFIEDSLKVKIREVLKLTNYEVQLEIKECESIETELQKQKAFLGGAFLTIAPSETVYTFLSVFSDAIYLVVFCEIKSDRQTLVDELLKHIKNPCFRWAVRCSLTGEASEHTRRNDTFVLGVADFRLDFNIKY